MEGVGCRVLGAECLNPTPCTLRPAPCTLHSTPFTLHPTPCTLHPAPYTLHPTPYTLHPTPFTLHPTTYTLHPTPYTCSARQTGAAISRRGTARSPPPPSLGRLSPASPPDTGYMVESHIRIHGLRAMYINGTGSTICVWG